jgi:flagellar assembly protein FliH
VNALGRAVTGLENQLMPTMHELQEAVLAHAFELAEAIVGRTLHDPEGRAVDALGRAMNAAPDHGDILVSLHPDDYRNLVGTATDTDYNYEGRAVHLRSDPTLNPGDAVAETGTTTVDASIGTAVARAREALHLD